MKKLLIMIFALALTAPAFAQDPDEAIEPSMPQTSEPQASTPQASAPQKSRPAGKMARAKKAKKVKKAHR